MDSTHLNAKMASASRVAIFLPSLAGGGAERAVVNLLKSMAEFDLQWDLVLASENGPYLSQVPAQVRIINLAVGGVMKAVIPLARYLQREQPSALISQMSHTNIAAVFAKDLARVQTPLILVEQQSLTGRPKLLRARLIPLLAKIFYPRAEAIVAVSKAMSKELEDKLRLPIDRIQVIPNSFIESEIISQGKQDVAHPWLVPGSIPVFLNVGRLTEQKDQGTLLRAFALVRQHQPCRLLILGEGEERKSLEKASRDLGIADAVSMPGFVDNPYAYMSQVDVFVLSSLWEGWPTVLVEAMACGCPVIATNCPTGASEILDDGKFGSLVPPQNPDALAKAMLESLKKPTSKHCLVQRAMQFSSQKMAIKFMKILQRL